MITDSISYSDSSYVKLEQNYLLIKGTPLKTTTGISYLWWLIGANHGRQVARSMQSLMLMPQAILQAVDTYPIFIIWNKTASN